MPRGRPPNPARMREIALNEELLKQDAATAQRGAAALARIDERYSDGVPYNRARLITEARSLVQLTGEALLGLGKRLLLLKEHEPHGDFLDALRTIGVETRFAQKAMQAALKFLPSNAAAPPHLTGIGQTKLIELLILDDEQIEELDEGGTVAGLTLDQIERMSTRELREALRKERAEKQREREVNDRVLKAKNDKIDELDRKLTHREAAPEAERNQMLVDEVWSAVLGCGAPLLRLEQTFRAVEDAHAEAPVPESVALARRQALTFLMQQLMEFQERWHIDVNLEEQVIPAWLKPEN